MARLALPRSADYQRLPPGDQRTVTTSDDETTTNDVSLSETLASLAIEMEPAHVEMLDRYRQLLWDWNEKINLTRHTTMEKFVTRDVVDSRALEPHLGFGDRVIDVGTGGGVPGVILKILRPDIDLILTETIAKKIKALEEIAVSTGIEARIYHGRAEDILTTRKAETLVVRAVAPLSKLCTWFQPLQHAFDQMLVIKGPGWVEERHEASQKRLLKKWQLRKLEEWPLPGTESNSVLLQLKRSQGGGRVEADDE
jgi:16S rRNA (guanine527-N7)-methyltransferase